MNGEYDFSLNKFALQLPRDVLREQEYQIDSCAHIDTPAYLLLNVYSQFECLIKAHLTVLTNFRIAAAVIGALNSDASACAFGLPDVLADLEGSEIFNPEATLSSALSSFGGLHLPFNVLLLLNCLLVHCTISFLTSRREYSVIIDNVVVPFRPGFLVPRTAEFRVVLFVVCESSFILDAPFSFEFFLLLGNQQDGF